MTSPGKLECRFFWERLKNDYLIFDRQRGAGCFGENFVATAVDGPTAELMCGLMNLAEQFDAPSRRLQVLFDDTEAEYTDEDVAADEAFEAQIAREEAAGFVRWAK